MVREQAKSNIIATDCARNTRDSEDSGNTKDQRECSGAIYICALCPWLPTAYESQLQAAHLQPRVSQQIRQET